MLILSVLCLYRVSECFYHLPQRPQIDHPPPPLERVGRHSDLPRDRELITCEAASRLELISRLELNLTAAAAAAAAELAALVRGAGEH